MRRFTRATDKDFLPAFDKIGALVTEEGGITSHAAIMGLEKGIPVIVAAKDVLSNVADGELITVDARRGLIYRGAAAII